MVAMDNAAAASGDAARGSFCEDDIWLLLGFGAFGEGNMK